MKSYEKDTNIINPIKLETAVENASTGGYPKLIEPIYVLLGNIIKTLEVISSTEANTITDDRIIQFKNHMQSFIDRLLKANLEDFELDKAANFDMATNLGLKNNLYANLLLGIYETSMEYVFLNYGITHDSSEKLLALFKKRKILIGILKDISTNEKGKKNTNFTVKSSISLGFASKIFQAVFSSNDEIMHSLRSDIDFAHFIVTNTCNSLKLAINDPYCHQDNECFNSSVDICRTYISILVHEDSDSIYANQQASTTKKTSSVLGSIATSVLSIMDIVSHIWPDRLIEFLRQLSPDMSTSVITKNSVITNVNMQLKEVVLKYLSGRTPIYKEASNVIRIIAFLCTKLEKKDNDFLKHACSIMDWLNCLAKERPMEEVGLAKDIMALLIQLSGMTGKFDTIQDICEDIHQFTGDLEVLQEESQLEQPPIKYQIVNHKTFTAITSKVFEFLDASFDDLTWCIGRLKISSIRSFDDTAKEFEKDLCQRLISIMNILSELVKSILTDFHAESLFKTLAKAYKTLHTLVKYKLNFVQDVSPDFINVISKCGTEITEKMYKFLTIYGQSQSQDLTERRSKKDKRKEVDIKRKAKIQRESKMIPNLIFAVEQFERHLIQLSRKSRVDFMQYMKRSTSRDFRIQLDRIQQESSDEEDVKKRPNNEEAGESSKRARLS
ncbi:FANCI solenoid 4-domain-containing protein [Cokeromyces recurvatus]|uniref:FANCI solenoid 4-domain-containing protein n=1 Tax=Cokeromyces recurvatus TaxID=90255 RepID=UPI002220C8EC|nr:FANCI solenoid 4-domain-containing protein [Cokeromyces recurvatus]KAI7907431.1 FANCI solenoid 4-domain-containing protein [Cokeromyces recurvatus]